MGILNMTFSPRISEKEKNPICILWSSVQLFTGIDTCVLNHFVLIKPNFTRQHIILDISDSMEFPPLSTETAELLTTDPVTVTLQRLLNLQTNDPLTMTLQELLNLQTNDPLTMTFQRLLNLQTNDPLTMTLH